MRKQEMLHKRLTNKPYLFILVDFLISTELFKVSKVREICTYKCFP